MSFDYYSGKSNVLANFNLQKSITQFGVTDERGRHGIQATMSMNSIGKTASGEQPESCPMTYDT